MPRVLLQPLAKTIAILWFPTYSPISILVTIESGISLSPRLVHLLRISLFVILVSTVNIVEYSHKHYLLVLITSSSCCTCASIFAPFVNMETSIGSNMRNFYDAMFQQVKRLHDEQRYDEADQLCFRLLANPVSSTYHHARYSLWPVVTTHYPAVDASGVSLYTTLEVSLNRFVLNTTYR